MSQAELATDSTVALYSQIFVLLLITDDAHFAQL